MHRYDIILFIYISYIPVFEKSKDYLARAFLVLIPRATAEALALATLTRSGRTFLATAPAAWAQRRAFFLTDVF